MAVAFTERRSDTIRIISARKANKREENTTKRRSRTNWARIDARKGEVIDTSDISEQGTAFFKRATLRLPEPKMSVTIRLDQQVLKWFKTKGPVYQTRINALLRAYMEAHKS